MTIGMIHGRFQPFHIGHFDYLQAALQLATKLYVGITNPDPTTTAASSSDAHRHLASSNPFPYYLRAQMVQQSLLADEATRARMSDVTIVPFPIHCPELWRYYIPAEHVTQFIRTLDPWDHEKHRLFERHGYDVVVLAGDRMFSGTEIRADLLAGSPAWRHKVPRGTLAVLQDWLPRQPPPDAWLREQPS